MGSLNLCRMEPDSMQKESVQSDHPVRRKRPKRAEILGYFDVGPKISKSDHILDVFSRQSGRIELIPFALSQAPCDTSLDYPQHIIPISLKFHFV